MKTTIRSAACSLKSSAVSRTLGELVQLDDGLSVRVTSLHKNRIEEVMLMIQDPNAQTEEKSASKEEAKPEPSQEKSGETDRKKQK